MFEKISKCFFLILVIAFQLNINQALATTELKGIDVDDIAADRKVFWNGFYPKGMVAREPSTFSRFLVDEEYVDTGSSVLDVACGNGRDTFFFHELGMRAVGIDASDEAIADNLAFAATRGLPADSFQVVDINNAALMATFQTYDQVYARFFLHSLNEAEQSKFLDFALGLKPSAKLLLEFRTDKDPMFLRSTKISETEGITDHYRRFINFEGFLSTLTGRGFEILYSREADGLSVRGDDNPFLGRIVAKKL